MRSMASSAILSYRLMLEQERTALFCVAGVTGFIYRIFLQHLGACGTMGVVAVRTRHLTFTDWMVRNTMLLRTLFLVAGKANFWLGFLDHDLVVLHMHLVA